MKVTYVGPFDAVEVSGLVVERGAVVDVDAALGKSLLDQGDNWAPVTAKKQKES
jgi:hypothetical protein